MTDDVITRRLALAAAGYTPVPLSGKAPVLKTWQQLENVSNEQIGMWTKTWPTATNTGALTKNTPTIDVDILVPDAAEAVEALARERFDERGPILVRTGRAPKRAIPLRTDTPFKKIQALLIAPNGDTDQKVELLCSGQQIVVFGIHPDTGKPYSWHGGKPGEVRHEDLPYVSEAEARAFVEDAVALLVREYGYQTQVAAPRKKRTNGGAESTDWRSFNVFEHADLVSYAMSLQRAGMVDGAVVNFLRAAVEDVVGGDDQKKQRRLKEIPGIVESGRAKIEAEQGAPVGAPKLEPAPPATLRQVIATFDRWLVLRDHTPIYAVLGAVAANLLPGDPVWLGIIAPPSSAKTEILNSLLRLPNVEPTATLTPAALLSGTPKRQRDKTAKGGLLNKIGTFGILLLKDFGSILSMRPDAKAETVAALREVFDGSWTRHLGTDGGRTLSWSGKVGFIFGATEAYDDFHGVIGSLGDRFLLCRLGPSFGGQLKRAMDHRGAATKTMREELGAAVAGLFTAALPEPPPLSDDEFQRLEDVVSLAVRLRAHVNRDRYSREIESIHGHEGPGRIGLCLERLLGGLGGIGVPRKHAMRIIEDITLDSTPPTRRHVFEMLTETATETRVIAIALRLPTTTTRRTLEDLAAQGLAVRTRGKTAEGEAKKGGADLWEIDPEWADWNAKWAGTLNHNPQD
jgi:hypothetical protein